MKPFVLIIAGVALFRVGLLFSPAQDTDKGERLRIVDSFSVQEFLKDARISEGKISNTVQDALSELLAILRKESGKPISLFVVGDVNFRAQVALEWTQASGEAVLQKLCKRLDWATFFTEHAVVIGPAPAIKRFQDAWKKQPEPNADKAWRTGLSWRFRRLSVRESSLAEVCDFLTKKQKEMGVSPILEFKPRIETKTRLWFDAEDLPIAVTATLISATIGHPVTEALGLFRQK